MQRFQGYVSMITGHLGQADRVGTFRGCRDYTIDAHWALYVDDHLEGFHTPFVHPGPNRIIDYEISAANCFATPACNGRSQWKANRHPTHAPVLPMTGGASLPSIGEYSRT